MVGNVTPGASQVVSLSFTVLSGSQAPPDGSLLTVVVSDRVHGASVSSSLTVRSTPPATLALSTQHGPVTPGSGFAYTLTYHNGAASPLSGAQLTLPLPLGVSFVSSKILAPQSDPFQRISWWQERTLQTVHTHRLKSRVFA